MVGGREGGRMHMMVGGVEDAHDGCKHHMTRPLQGHPHLPCQPCLLPSNPARHTEAANDQSSKQVNKDSSA